MMIEEMMDCGDITCPMMSRENSDGIVCGQ